jgi:hypothetical protein
VESTNAGDAMTDAPFTETHRETLRRAMNIGTSSWEPFEVELMTAIRAALAEIDRLTRVQVVVLELLKDRHVVNDSSAYELRDLLLEAIAAEGSAL